MPKYLAIYEHTLKLLQNKTDHVAMTATPYQKLLKDEDFSKMSQKGG